MKNILLLSIFIFGITDSFAQIQSKNVRTEYTFEDVIRNGAARPEKFLESSETLPPAKPKSKLGTIDKWRYESCQQEAGSAPTPQGVILKKRVCDEQFDQ